MPWIERNPDQSIKSLFERRQPGTAEEFLPESDAEVQAKRNRRNRTDSEKVEAAFQINPALRALLKRTARVEGKTERAVLDEIKAEL